jgi:hypothetical protein
MTEEKKELKVVFAPGAFDDFDGTQEELDALQKELVEMFSNLTPEELAEQSQAVDFEELMEEDPALAEKLLSSFDKEPTRKLQ